jgi:hypothetical protein
MMRPSTRADLTNWLYHLDSYTNAELGHARTLRASEDLCVACGARAPDPDVRGLCLKCAAQRRPDHTEVILFKPLRRRAHASSD